ncbi:hypothetical protein [Adhaeribacter aquaticus]|uniref:hypothetical protein n=1 Tax=Adhaeribacter aquaticus TaxID=299567 RepID=UPI000425541B|nr:hypothetical protein [Adhaeribacter aquaticus]
MFRRRYLRLLAFLAILFYSSLQALFAQRLDIQEWPKGRIVLVSGDTLYGPITYHRSEDIIRITLEDGSIGAYAPVNVISFTVTDDNNRYTQTFKPFLWNRGNDYSDYKAPAFFELVNEGQYTLVKREMVTTQNTINNYPMYAGYGRYYDPYGYSNYGPRYQTIIIDLLYLYTPEKKIKALRNPKRDLEDLFNDQNKEKEMKEFVKNNNLSYNNTRDLALIVRHYNSLL